MFVGGCQETEQGNVETFAASVRKINGFSAARCERNSSIKTGVKQKKTKVSGRNNISIDDTDLVDQAEDTMTILSKYIDGMEINGDRKKLQALLQELYTEAVRMEFE